MNEENVLDESELLEEEKKKHHPWQVWVTARKRYRAMGPPPKYRQRSFNTYKEAAAWLQSIRDKDKELYILKTKYQITPRTEIKKIIHYLREEYSKEEPDFKHMVREVYKALSKIYMKMKD